MWLLRAMLVLLALAIASPAGAEGQEKGYLGLNVQDLSHEDAAALGWSAPRGTKVVYPDQGLPAAMAGVREDDVIVSIDGVEIENAAAFATAVSSRSPGTEVSLRVLRHGKELRFTLTLLTRPLAIDKASQLQMCSKYLPDIDRAVEVPCE